MAEALGRPVGGQLEALRPAGYLGKALRRPGGVLEAWRSEGLEALEVWIPGCLDALEA